MSADSRATFPACDVLTPTMAADASGLRSARQLDPGRDAVNAIGRLAWYAGCLTMPALALRVWILTVSDVCFGVAGLAAALSMARHRADRARPSWTIAGALAVVAAVLAHPVTGQEGESLAVAIRLVLIWVVWRWIGVSLLGRTEHVDRSLVLFLVGSAISALVALAQVGLGVSVFGPTVVGIDSRAAGLAGHVNHQGGQLAVAFGVAVALAIHRTVARSIVMILAAAIAVGLVLSGSVTGMLSAAAATMYLFVRTGGVGRRIKIAVVVAAGAYLALRIQQHFGGASPWERFSGATGGRSPTTNTLETRLETMRYARDSITDNPWFGVGLDQVSGGTMGGPTLAHNIALLFWYQGGIVLFAALVLALVSVWRLVFGRNPVAPWLESALGAGFVAALCFALTAPVMFDRYFWFTAMLAFPLAAVTHRRSSAAPNGLRS